MIGEIIGKMFGTDKALGSIVDGVSNGLDKLFYTDEEKAEDGAKERAAARAAVIGWMETSKGQNIARRVIALAITFAWLGQYLVAWAMSMAAVFLDTAMSGKMTEAATLTSANGEKMIGAVMLILAFYFAAPHMGKIVDGAMAKFGSDNSSKPPAQ